MDEEKIIQKYNLPIYTNNSLSSCDFHLNGEKTEDNDSTTSSCIPITLRETEANDMSNPYLILFYYQNQERLLDKWEEAIEEMSTSPYPSIVVPLSGGTCVGISPPILKSVNLSYEKEILNTFKNLSLSNPFRWTKIFHEEKNHFVLFYNNTFPIEFYDKELDKDIIKDEYYGTSLINWYTKFEGMSYIDTKKEEKFKSFDHLELKDNYFVALEDGVPDPSIVKGKHYRVINRGGDILEFREV